MFEGIVIILLGTGAGSALLLGWAIGIYLTKRKMQAVHASVMKINRAALSAALQARDVQKGARQAELKMKMDNERAFRSEILMLTDRVDRVAIAYEDETGKTFDFNAISKQRRADGSTPSNDDKFNEAAKNVMTEVVNEAVEKVMAGAEPKFMKERGKIVDTKVATGDIDQVIIKAPEGSTVKLKDKFSDDVDRPIEDGDVSHEQGLRE